jgi:hypothetical protein
VSLWTSLEPASATVDPGSTTTVQLRLRNTGDVVDEYHFEPVGDIAPWTTVEPQTLRLFPGTTGTVQLRFEPPRTPDATAGPNPYAVRITPTEHPEATTVPEGNLTITPFTEMRAELVPPTVKGRFRGRPRLAIDNLGNTKLTASLDGNDNGDQLSYDIRPSSVQVEPGRAVFVKATLRPRKIIWFGTKEQRPYRLSVLRSGSKPHPVEGTYVQRGFLPRWLATFFGVIAALALTFVMLWIAHKPAVNSGATEKVVEAGATLTPTPTATLAPPPPSTAPARTTQPTTSGGSGGSTQKPAAPQLPKSPQAPKSPTIPKPIDYWPIRPGTLGADETGVHPAAVSNVTGTDGHGGAGLFNGKDSQLTTSEMVVPTGPDKSFTISAWVYLNSTSSFATAVSQNGAHDSGFYLQYSLEDGRWAFSRVQTDGGDSDKNHYRALSLAPPALHTWTHLVGVFNASNDNLTLYVNGAPQGTAQDIAPFATGGKFVIGRGRFGDAAVDWFNGQINEVTAWGQALTAAQVKELH